MIPFPSEFTTNSQTEVAESVLGHCGRMVSGSKSGYSSRHPKNIVVFNANVFYLGEKIWYGDLDLTLDEDKIVTLAKNLGGGILHVLRESDGRFGAESNPPLDRAVFTTDGTRKLYKERA